jgi:hypothetical protein
MGGWVLAAAAAGFWLGIFAAGSAAVLRGSAEAVLLMVGGLAWLAALALGGWATEESRSASARRHAAAFVGSWHWAPAGDHCGSKRCPHRRSLGSQADPSS